MTIIDIVKGFFLIGFGVTLILAGVLNWKCVLFMTHTAEVLVGYIGMTLYRVLFIAIGVLWLVWLVVGIMGQY